MRVVGSPGTRPILRNVSKEEVQAFRKQVRVVNMIGCEEENQIIERLGEVAQTQYSYSCVACRKEPASISTVPVVHAKEPTRKAMDKAAYFVIIPPPEKKLISVEHYSYDNGLLGTIEGKDARSIYWTIIKNSWVTQLSHAAYLGKQLMKAELSIRLGFKYVQDGP